MTNPKPAELPVRLFKDDDAWEAWLAKQHGKSAGLWLRIGAASGASGRRSTARKCSSRRERPRGTR
jgi:hypothetical protein